jgi:carboxyl-terminal processing protease
MPDIFVPIDTVAYSDYYRDLIRKGIINRYILNYMDKNRAELERKYKNHKKHGTFAYFIENFEVDDAFLKDFIAFAENEKLPFDEEGYTKSYASLKANLKALIARDIWGTSEFYEVVNVLDPIYNEAVKVMLDDKAYQSKLNLSK